MRRIGVAAAATCLLVFLLLTAASAAGPTYVFVGKFGAPGSGPGQFAQPGGLAIAPSNGDVYVADTLNDRVQEFTATGTFVRAFGTSAELAHPVDVAVDRGAPFAVYVTDTNNHRIRKYSSDGQLIATWGTNGTRPGQLVLPRGLATDAGSLYVAQPDRVTKFTLDGGFITTWGSIGSAEGQFRYLADVAVDPSGNVYTVDRDLDRVQQFTSSGAFVRMWGRRGSGEGEFSGPLGIAADETGVYVTDYGNTRVQKFTLDGAFVTQWGTRGTGNGQFTSPTGIAVSPLPPRDVYVLDFLGCCSRVQYFRAGGGGGGQLPPPPAGTANASVVSGTVLVRVRGTNRFVPLAAAQIPVGSEVDATRGRVRLTSLARAGATQTADFYQGRFVLAEAGTGPARLATLRLSGPLACRRAAARGAKRQRERHLWGNGKGAFRTRGKYAAATVRGTVWLTRDTCPGTLVRVRSGRVQVLDLPRRRSVLVPAGKSYFARRP